MILLQKLNDFSAITPADSSAKLLWVLQKEGSRNLFINPHGSFTRDLWERFPDSVFRILTGSFELTFSFGDLVHEDSPEEFEGRFTLTCGIAPRMEGFGDFIAGNGICNLTLEYLQTYFEERKYLFQSLILQSFAAESPGELIHSGAGKLLQLPPENDLPEWITVSSIRLVSLTRKISEEQKKIQTYNSWVAKEEENLQYGRQQLEYDTAKANIDEARREITRLAELAETAHRHKLEEKEREQKLRLLSYELSEMRKKDEESFRQKELQANMDKLELENAASKANTALIQKKIEEKDAVIKRIRLSTEIAAAELAAAQEASAVKKAEAQERLEILTLSKEREMLSIRKLRKELESLEDSWGKMKEAVAEGNLPLAAEIRNLFTEAANSRVKEEEQLLHNMEELLSAVLLKIPSQPKSLVQTVREQKSRQAVRVKKEASFETNCLYQSRDFSIRIKVPEVTAGSSMRFSFNSELAGFLTVICFASSGAVQLIEPNCIDGLRQIESGKKYTLPGEDFLHGYEGVAQEGPAGNEQLLVIVSKESLAEIFHDQEELEEFDLLTKEQLDALSRKLALLDKDSWAAGYLAYKVMVPGN